MANSDAGTVAQYGKTGAVKDASRLGKFCRLQEEVGQEATGGRVEGEEAGCWIVR